MEVRVRPGRCANGADTYSASRLQRSQMQWRP